MGAAGTLVRSTLDQSTVPYPTEGDININFNGGTEILVKIGSLKKFKDQYENVFEGDFDGTDYTVSSLDYPNDEIILTEIASPEILNNLSVLNYTHNKNDNDAPVSVTVLQDGELVATLAAGQRYDVEELPFGAVITVYSASKLDKFQISTDGGDFYSDIDNKFETTIVASDTAILLEAFSPRLTSVVVDNKSSQTQTYNYNGNAASLNSLNTSFIKPLVNNSNLLANIPDNTKITFKTYNNIGDLVGTLTLDHSQISSYGITFTSDYGYRIIFEDMVPPELIDYPITWPEE